MHRSRILRTLFFGIAVFVFSASHMAAAEVWTGVRTANFYVIGDASEAQIRQAGERLEEFREIFHQLFPKFKLDGGTRTNVIVFKNNVSYKPYKPKRADGSTDDLVLGFFQPGEDVNYIAFALGEKADPYSTVFHEYIHFIIDTNVGGETLPLWLSEGLAEYFETLRLDASGNVVLGTPPEGHVRRLQKQMLPLEEFFSTGDETLKTKNDETRARLYAQSWAAVHYIFSSGSETLGRVMDRLIELAAKRDVTERDFLKLFPAERSSLDTKLSAYLNAPTIPTTTVTLAAKTPKITAPATTQLSEGQRLAYLGDLLSRTGRFAEAEPMLRRAAAADPKLDVPNIALGLESIRQNRLSDARKYLERAIAAGTDNHLAHFYFAYAISRATLDESGNISSYPDDRYRTMRNALTKAISLSPSFVESYRLLAFISLVNDTDLETAVVSIKKAIEIDPAKDEHKLLLAQLLLRQEKYDQAAEIAANLAGGAKDSRVWSEARQIIQVVNQYKFAKATESPTGDGRLRIGVSGQPPLILKRSALTDADLARIDEEREINNLNILLGTPVPNETRAAGIIEKIECGDNGIRYTVRSKREKLVLSSSDFSGVKMRVLTEGERSFTLGCGSGFGRQLAVVTYISARNSTRGATGRLAAIAFVPDFFRLKTAEEMATSRLIIVEDDRIFKTRETPRPK